MKIGRDLRTALSEDGIGYLIGLAVPTLFYVAGQPIPLPVLYATYRWCRHTAHQFRRTEYVDWALPDWPLRYRGEAAKFLPIQRQGRDVLLPQVLVHENSTGRPIGDFNLKFEFHAAPFAVHAAVRARTERAFAAVSRRLRRRATFYNEEAVRLTGVVERAHHLSLQTQPASYESYLHTNLLLDYQRGGPTLRDQIHGNGLLDDLHSSALANILGINILAFTADGRLVLQKRSTKVDVRPGELAPAGSGSVTRGDAEAARSANLRPAVILREATEETGFTADTAQPGSLIYLGVTRELIRGGKPEIFFAVQSRLSETEIRARAAKAQDRQEFTRLRLVDGGAA